MRECRFRGSGVQGSGFKVQGSEVQRFRVQGSGVQPSRRQKTAGLIEKETLEKRISNIE
ncbi:hypothetical protein D1AOALGA4SA_6059 [Olavius algarvensis Delta 1 endosymbiont]|nr:hypothetical protein D1AOALGA4SA_6059 [Olavius algarvensis Delta 1 endosymbiont]